MTLVTRIYLRGFRLSCVPAERENGIPDLRLIDDQEKCRVIIENKFWALLTDKQPGAYFRELPPNGLVLFVVPRSCRKRLWVQMQDRCREPITQCNVANGCYIGRTGEQYIAVISWDHLLSGSRPIEQDDPDFAIFIEQLRRLCKVEEENKIEMLSPSAMASKEIAKSVHSYMKLATQIVEAAEDADCFVPKKPQPKDSCGEIRIGKWGDISGFRGGRF